jgi:hypothetical protein
VRQGQDACEPALDIEGEGAKVPRSSPKMTTMRSIMPRRMVIASSRRCGWPSSGAGWRYGRLTAALIA